MTIVGTDLSDLEAPNRSHNSFIEILPPGNRVHYRSLNINGL